MLDTRLIERWLPIGALGEESARERRSLQALPPTYYLHAWWARRPLIASRAAILASLLSEDADQDKFMHAMGIHGDPVGTKKRIDLAKKTKENLGLNPYGYERAFKYRPSLSEREWIKRSLILTGTEQPIVLDPTAGGGSIPFESVRLGLPTFGNDLNPVATLIEKATIEFPVLHGNAVRSEFRKLAKEFSARAEPRFAGIFPVEVDKAQVTGYLWARTIKCPYCSGVVPLSPNWRLAPDGRGIRLVPQLGSGPHDPLRRVDFEIVEKLVAQSSGTVSDGDGMCPYSDCNRQIDGDIIKSQAQAGDMGEVLYAVVVKRQIMKATKSGKLKESWEKSYRVSTLHDDNSEMIKLRMKEKIPEWEALGFIPNEPIPFGQKTEEPRRYGMTEWRHLFTSRQLFGHCTAVEVFNELLDDVKISGQLSDISKAAFVYLSFSIDKFLNWNSILSSWNVQLESLRSVFDRHDFAFKWTFAEMPPLIVGLGYEWVIDQTEKCIGELVELVRPDSSDVNEQPGLFSSIASPPPSLTLSCKSAESLDHIMDATVDCVVMDPPYYDNVMYAELSDFFYVWLKRTAGRVYPELFRRQLTDKENEAVANPSKFHGEKGAKALAGREYQDRMATIFSECHRVLKANGILTLMFTHKATGAWDAITKGLMEAGFTITASWPINTEAGGSLHIKNKAAANSTIFLVCRPRESNAVLEQVYWEDVEPLVAKAVRNNVQRFKESGIGGVDLYLASFGPALEEFSKHWPIKRGTPRPKPEVLKRRRQSELFEEGFDPYAVTPEDALDAARREVKNWKLEQLTHMKTNAELDHATAWFVLAWDAFRAPIFDYDEALRLARAVGTDLDKDIIGRLAEKKGSEVRLWDSGTRAAKGALGPADGSRSMIDAIHHASHIGRTRTLDAAHELLTKNYVDQDPKFYASLEAVLEVLPVPKAFSGIDLEGDVAAQGSDFEVLENLRRLAFSDKVDEPRQLDLWKAESAAS